MLRRTLKILIYRNRFSLVSILRNENHKPINHHSYPSVKENFNVSIKLHYLYQEQLKVNQVHRITFLVKETSFLEASRLNLIKARTSPRKHTNISKTQCVLVLIKIKLDDSVVNDYVVVNNVYITI